MTADPCLMPVAGDRLCYLPGDHDGGCQAAPRCRCSHARTLHTRVGGQCWIGVCGCRGFRPDRHAEFEAEVNALPALIDNASDRLYAIGELEPDDQDEDGELMPSLSLPSIDTRQEQDQ